MNTKEEELDEELGLKREIGFLGSFSMGYADVGADIYITLGLIALYAQNASPFALLLAAIPYVTTGLTYAELATLFPVAGGGQYYATKALGRIHGFIAGWGLILDYTIDIALFSLAASGYLGFLIKALTGNSMLLTSPYYGLFASLLIALLIILNVIGIKYSSRFNESIVLVNLLTMGLILALGLCKALVTGRLYKWINSLNSAELLNSSDFPYAVTIAMASFIGIESISQAAEETRRPSKVIPKATKASIAAVLTLAVGLSTLSVTLLPWRVIAYSAQDPMSRLASEIPYLILLPYWVSLLGFLTNYISANTGIIGVSRVTFSMGRLKLLPQSFRKIHPKYRTPYLTITVFSLIAMSLILVNVYLPGVDLLVFIASLYNFGALITYMYVNLSALILRVKYNVKRPWKTPLNIEVKLKDEAVEVSLIHIIGFASCLIMWILLLLTHENARILGILWLMFGLIAYKLFEKAFVKH